MKRRYFLGCLGSATVLGGLAFWKRDELIQAGFSNLVNNEDVTISTNDIASCIMNPVQTEGPFYVESPFRSDIREDRSGLEFEPAIQIVENNSCTPLEKAVVQIWH